jgi:hypothetical protein
MDRLPAQQLDIFEDSRDVMLRNDLAQAVLAGDIAAATGAWRALQAEFAHDPALADAALLTAALQADSTSPLADPDAVATARVMLDDTLAPAATRLFGKTQAAAWMTSAWRQLARRAAALPFETEHADLHAAALWLRAAAWPEVAAAVERIASWRRIPAPLAWMAQARWHLAGLDATWPLLAELAWRAPQRLAPLMQALPDPTLHRRLRRFQRDFEADFEGAGTGDTMAWFPAWALTDEPRLLGPLDAAEATQHSEPERAAQLLLALLRLERQGRHADVIEHRRRLQGLHAGLFSAYMKSR